MNLQQLTEVKKKEKEDILEPIENIKIEVSRKKEEYEGNMKKLQEN